MAGDATDVVGGWSPADDHPVVRDGLRGMLAGEPDLEVVGEAADGQQAVARVAIFDPDVVLMGLRMPNLDGVGAIRRLTAQRARARVLVLTTYDTDRDVLAAIDAGATGYLLEDAPREELWCGTVKTHLLHTDTKLGVNDRAAAVAAAYRRGLLTVDDERVDPGTP
jgi:DNA-binding NarL/FixJ family response regulator